MVPYLRLIPAAQSNKLVKHYLQARPHQVSLDLPVQMFDWHKFIGKAKPFLGKMLCFSLVVVWQPFPAKGYSLIFVRL
jgi:hypothetical protein